MNSSRTVQTVLAAVLLAAATVCNAQFPNKPIRLVIPYPAGGGTDIMARIMQTHLVAALGQPVIVDNKPGAAGALGTAEVARSAPDGYTLIFTNNGPGAITPLMQKSAGYDPVKDFAAVSTVSLAPMFMVANSSKLPVKDVKGLIEFARKNPDKVEYSTAGIGSFGHLATALFANKAGIKLFHVPYKGGGPSALAVDTGEVKMMMTTATNTMRNGIKDGKLTLLGVSSLKRTSLAPGVPTISETVPGYEINVWFGILAPAGTPREAIAKLNEAITKAVSDPTVKQRFADLGFDAEANTPAKFDAMVAAEVERWRTVIREANIPTE